MKKYMKKKLLYDDYINFALKEVILEDLEKTLVRNKFFKSSPSFLNKSGDNYVWSTLSYKWILILVSGLIAEDLDVKNSLDFKNIKKVLRQLEKDALIVKGKTKKLDDDVIMYYSMPSFKIDPPALVTKVEDPSEKNVNKLLDVFYEHNKAFNYGNKANRKAALLLINQYGPDTAVKLAEAAMACQGAKFAPIIGNPTALKNKLIELKGFYQRQQGANKLSF